MAELTFFHYRPGRSPLHRIHPSLKMLGLFLCSIGAANASPAGLLYLNLSAGAFFFLLRNLPGRFVDQVKGIRGILLLLGILWIVRSLSWENGVLPTFSLSSFYRGGLYSWKILSILLLSHLFLLTTSSSDLHYAVYNPLSRIPFIPAGRIALMIRLMLTFIPVIMDRYSESRDAWKSRGGNLPGTGIIRRIKTLLLPVVVSLFTYADEIVWALENRCYSDRPARRHYPWGIPDLLFFLWAVAFFTLLPISAVSFEIRS